MGLPLGFFIYNFKIHSNNKDLKLNFYHIVLLT
jgi:hypothetical protein